MLSLNSMIYLTTHRILNFHDLFLAVFQFMGSFNILAWSNAVKQGSTGLDDDITHYFSRVQTYRATWPSMVRIYRSISASRASQNMCQSLFFFFFLVSSQFFLYGILFSVYSRYSARLLRVSMSW